MDVATRGGEPAFRVGPWRVFPDQLRIDGRERQVVLEPRLMQLLVYLSEHAGQVIPAESLLRDIWGGTFYGDAPVQRAVALLRRALGDDAVAPKYVQTLRKQGYRLIAPVVHADAYARALSEHRPAWHGDNPYRGLRPFRRNDAGVFFGRTQACAALLGQFRAQCAAGKPFLLILGASGCGKTSLLNAGILPALATDSGFDGLRARAVAHVDLSDSPDYDCIDALRDGLRAAGAEGHGALCELTRSRLLSVDAPQAIVDAVDGAARAHLEQGLYLLVIDHAERLASGASAQAVVDQFSAIIGRLLASAHAGVLMLARSDLYPGLLQAVPRLAEWKRPQGHFDLLLPGWADTGEMIRGPARIAGTRFERDSKSWRGLDDILQEEAAGQPNPLPLLQFALATLFERRTPDGVLSLAAYREMGGLRGAIAHRANEALSGLTPDIAHARLGKLLASLVSCSADGEASTGRLVAWDSLIEAGVIDLAERLVCARLLVADLEDAKPKVALAHEALLDVWTPAAAWIRNNRQRLAARTRLREGACRWLAEGRRRDLLLHGGLPLQEAADLVERSGWQFEGSERTYYAASRARSRQNRWLTVALSGTVSALLVATALTWMWARRAEVEGEKQRVDREHLASVMVNDLADQLRPLGRLELLDTISSAVLATTSNASTCVDEKVDPLQHAKALRTQAEVQYNRGDTTAAMSTLEQARQCLATLGSQLIDSPDTLFEWGTIGFWLGNVAFLDKRYDEAAMQLGIYADVTQSLHAQDPENVRWTLEQSYALNNLGSLAQARGDLSGASELFERSARLKLEVLAARPEDTTVMAELADTYSWLGSSSERLGDIERAGDYFGKQVDILLGLVRAEPWAAQWRSRLGGAYLRSAELHAGSEPQTARTDFARAIENLLAASKTDASNRRSQRTLALAYIKYAGFATEEGDLAGALANLDLAQPLLAAAEATIELPAQEQLLLAQFILRRAELAAAVGDDSATREAASSIGIFANLLKQSPGDIEVAKGFLQSAILQGDLSLKNGREGAARSAWQSGLNQLPAELAHHNDRRLTTASAALRARLDKVSLARGLSE